jgi:hypothetical protein
VHVAPGRREPVEGVVRGRGEAQYKSVGAQAPPPIPEFLQVQ